MLKNKQINFKRKQPKQNMVHPKPKRTGYQLGGNPQETGEEDRRRSIPLGHPVLSLPGPGSPGSCRSPVPHTASESRFTAQMYGHAQARNKGLCPTLGQDLLLVMKKGHVQWSRSVHPLTHRPELMTCVYFLLNNKKKKRTLILRHGKHNTTLSSNETH